MRRVFSARSCRLATRTEVQISSSLRYCQTPAPQPPPPPSQQGTSPAASVQATSAAEATTSATAAAASRDQFLAAVKGRNFGAAQIHAVSYVQSQWKEEYLLPLACLLVLAIVRYWLASGQRKIQRICDAAEAKAKEDSEALREQVRSLSSRWQRDSRSRENQVQTVFDKNSEMTRTIDELAAALKSCAPRAFGASAALA